MRKWILAVCCFLTAVVLCCGCGQKSGTILIGSGENQEAENRSREVAGEDGSSQEVGHAGETSSEEAAICVYVCGAVVSPGVVEISAGSRVEDALKAAGGFTPEAGREAVNLADWVTDGQMLYFPTQEEALEEKAREEEAASGLININTADAAALCTLPGVGESRAADIIAYREANGGFENCEDIMKVPGIKTAMYEKIRDKITVR